MHSSEIIVFHQLNVDLFFEIWYDEYVGAAVGRSVFVSVTSQKIRPDRRNRTKEMTLDCLFFSNFFFSQGSFLFILII